MESRIVEVEGSDHLVVIDPDYQYVEGWSSWNLPFMKLSESQQAHKQVLRQCIPKLATNGALIARHAAEGPITRRPDLENVLFYNLGMSVFRRVAARSLSFEQYMGQIPRPIRALRPGPLVYVRYEADHGQTHRNSRAYLASARVKCSSSKELLDRAKLWRLFKEAMTCDSGHIRPDPEFYGLEVNISVPGNVTFQPPAIVKPATDGFMSALHCYSGKQLDQIALRLGERLSWPSHRIENLLLRSTTAVLGARGVPHLFGADLQWSPSDDLLKGAVFTRIASARHSINIEGRLYCYSISDSAGGA